MDTLLICGIMLICTGIHCVIGGELINAIRSLNTNKNRGEIG